MAKCIPTELEDEMKALQRRIVNEKHRVLVIVESRSGSVIGRTANELMNILEPRVTKYTHFIPVSKLDSPMEISGYLQKEPAAGTMAIYDRSWYSAMMMAHNQGRATEEFIIEAHGIENYFTYNGIIIVKIYLDIDDDEIAKRSKEFGESRTKDDTFLTDDHIGAKAFDQKFFRKTMDRTSSFHAPWSVVRVSDVSTTVCEVAEIIKKRVEEGITRTLPDHGLRVEAIYRNPREDADLTLKADDYKKDLNRLSKELRRQQHKLAASNRSLILVFEGWDAAGKGGTIRRVARALNPRGYEAVGVAAPVGDEKLHTYLWRFTRQMPEKGHIVIFDRSWYGRMMVEPIEGFCTTEEYERSASEIRFFERAITEAGGIVIKFWMEISPEEQLARFKDRQEDPLKQWKITDEDWRNREKWETYEGYINKMIASTNIPEAPWIVAESEDKQYGRLKVMQAIVDILEKTLRNVFILPAPGSPGAHALHFPTYPSRYCGYVAAPDSFTSIDETTIRHYYIPSEHPLQQDDRGVQAEDSRRDRHVPGTRQGHEEMARGVRTIPAPAGGFHGHFPLRGERLRIREAQVPRRVGHQEDGRCPDIPGSGQRLAGHIEIQSRLQARLHHSDGRVRRRRRRR